MRVYGYRCTLFRMSTTLTGEIAAKVRGLAAEKRFTQQRIADTLDCSRTSVVERMNGRVPFTATEIMTLAAEMNVPISRFFPEAEGVSAQ